MTQIAPSLLSADFAHMEREIEMLNGSEADWLHFDVMDGSFVPNISFGFPIMAALGRAVTKPLDVHMMVVRPEQWVQQVARCGARMMTVHQEACPHLHRTVQQIHEAGMLAGVAVNPGTPLVMLDEIIDDADLLLVMTVNPGFGGQKFIPAMTDKVRRLKATLRDRGAHALIECDGGVDLQTGAELVKAGVDILVTGSTVFHSPDPAATIRALKAL